MPVEQFLSMLRFDNGGELDDLGFEIYQNKLKTSELRFESGFYVSRDIITMQ